MEIREVKIEEYWPLIVKNTVEFGQIAAAENPEFNRLAKCIYQVLQESFVHDATEYGVKRWETILGINPASGATIDDRKATILTYLNVKVPYTWRVLKQMLVGILGEDKFVMEYLNDEAKLVLHTDRLNDTMLATVSDLLARVLPMNIEVVHTNYFTWLPSDYTAVEYLESSYKQLIDTGVVPDNETGALCDIAFTQNRAVAIACKDSNGSWGTPRAFVNWNNMCGYPWGTWHDLSIVGISAFDRNVCSINWLNNRLARIEGIEKTQEELLPELPYTPSASISLFGRSDDLWSGKMYGAQISQGKNIICYFVPCLDETGAPCMFDMVRRKPFYNAGSGDFLYPTDAAPAAAIGLDDKFYAQLTEHGVRRLYKVPDGCNMTKDAYAAANGFKELVEPPIPSTGYWKPEWRETDTQLILDWIETEPSMEVNENE